MHNQVHISNRSTNYLHEFHAGLQRMIPAEQQKEVFLHRQNLGQLTNKKRTASIRFFLILGGKFTQLFVLIIHGSRDQLKNLLDKETGSLIVKGKKAVLITSLVWGAEYLVVSTIKGWYTQHFSVTSATVGLSTRLHFLAKATEQPRAGKG